MRTQMRIALLVFSVVSTGPVAAFAQTTELPAVQYSWGAIHRGPGQALAINFSVPDAPDFGPPTSFAAVLRLTDADGRVVYETKAEGISGRALSFVITSDERAAMKTIPGDLYAVIDPNDRIIQASILVASLSERVPLAPERVISTLEVIELSSGRLIDFSANPRVVVPDAPD